MSSLIAKEKPNTKQQIADLEFDCAQLLTNLEDCVQSKRALESIQKEWNQIFTEAREAPYFDDQEVKKSLAMATVVFIEGSVRPNERDALLESLGKSSISFKARVLTYLSLDAVDRKIGKFREKIQKAEESRRQLEGELEGLRSLPLNLSQGPRQNDSQEARIRDIRDKILKADQQIGSFQREIESVRKALLEPQLNWVIEAIKRENIPDACEFLEFVQKRFPSNCDYFSRGIDQVLQEWMREGEYNRVEKIVCVLKIIQPNLGKVFDQMIRDVLPRVGRDQFGELVRLAFSVAGEIADPGEKRLFIFNNAGFFLEHLERFGKEARNIDPEVLETLFYLIRQLDVTRDRDRFLCRVASFFCTLYDDCNRALFVTRSICDYHTQKEEMGRIEAFREMIWSEWSEKEYPRLKQKPGDNLSWFTAVNQSDLKLFPDGSVVDQMIEYVALIKARIKDQNYRDADKILCEETAGQRLGQIAAVLETVPRDSRTFAWDRLRDQISLLSTKVLQIRSDAFFATNKSEQLVAQGLSLTDQFKPDADALALEDAFIDFEEQTVPDQGVADASRSIVFARDLSFQKTIVAMSGRILSPSLKMSKDWKSCQEALSVACPRIPLDFARQTPSQQFLEAFKVSFSSYQRANRNEFDQRSLLQEFVKVIVDSCETLDSPQMFVAIGEMEEQFSEALSWEQWRSLQGASRMGKNRAERIMEIISKNPPVRDNLEAYSAIAAYLSFCGESRVVEQGIRDTSAIYYPSERRKLPEFLGGRLQIFAVQGAKRQRKEVCSRCRLRWPVYEAIHSAARDSGFNLNSMGQRRRVF